MSANCYLLSPYSGDAREPLNRNKKETEALTQDRIEKRISAIEKTIRNQSVRNTLNIAAGCEDFFNSSHLTANRCMDMEKVYELIGPNGPFVRLSQKYKNWLIVPGSLYISTPIPKEHDQHSFFQDGQRQLLSAATCYTSNIAPVFFQGKLLRVIRKGEMIEQNINGRSNPIKSTEDLSKLATSRLDVISYREDSLTDLHEGEKTSTCYLGKTLLPGEKRAIIRHLQTDDLDELFNHECKIGDKKFLFVICAEFRGENSTTGALLENEQDFLIHMCEGGPIPKAMRPNTSCYIHTDKGQTTQVEVQKANGDWETLPLAESADQHHNLRIHATVLPKIPQ